LEQKQGVLEMVNRGGGGSSKAGFAAERLVKQKDEEAEKLPVERLEAERWGRGFVCDLRVSRA
jgi:hypothetical protein